MKREKIRFRTLLTSLTVGAVSIGLLLSACQTSATTRDIEAVVQAVDGQKVVLTLDDGSKVRIEAKKLVDDAKNMIGAEVKARVKVSDDSPELIKIEKVSEQTVSMIPGLQASPEDFHFGGVIESMGTDTWTIGGKAFKVNAATIKDNGLAVGVIAQTEFIMLADGSLLATKVETDADDNIVLAQGQPVSQIAEDFSLAGVIGSISANQLVLGGKTFKMDANTLRDQGLMAGILAKVEFVVQADGSFLALEVETDAPATAIPGKPITRQEDYTAGGPIQSMEKGFVMVDGRKFIVDASTKLDSGLSPNVLVKVEFVIKPDGTLLATEIETAGIDEGLNLYFAGPIESMSPTAWTIGGKSFAVIPTTQFDQGLALGINANVEFTIKPDGSFQAVHIENTGFRFIGMVQAIAPDAISIGGRIFKTNANTLVDQGLKVRKLAQVEFLIQPDGTLLALQVKVPKIKTLGFTFKGVMQSTTATSMAVTGQTFQIDPTTIVGAGVAAGTEVNIVFDIKPGNILSAISVQNAKVAQTK